MPSVGPAPVEKFKFSKDRQFIQKVRDIVGLYMNPPDRAIVLSVDERSHEQALNRTQPTLPLAAGAPAARQSHEYERRGVKSLFAALEVGSGVTINNSYRQHRIKSPCGSSNDIDANLPANFDVHLVLNNYGTHKLQRIRPWLASHPRHHVHLTPTSGSWVNRVNLVERLFAELTERCVRRGRPHGCALHREIHARLPGSSQSRPKSTSFGFGAPIPSSGTSRVFVKRFLTQDTEVVNAAEPSGSLLNRRRR